MVCFSKKENSSHTLHKIVERLAKHVERDNAKIDALEKEKEQLTSANNALAAEQVRLIEAKDGVVATSELVEGELRVAHSAIERSDGEISQMIRCAEQAKGPIASLHSSLKKHLDSDAKPFWMFLRNEEDLKSVLADNDKLRLLVKDVEDFKNGQVQSIQNHVEE